jgi:hypothetical protein
MAGSGRVSQSELMVLKVRICQKHYVVGLFEGLLSRFAWALMLMWLNRKALYGVEFMQLLLNTEA